MLQRIQTVYLLIITILFVVILFCPLVIVQSAGQFYSFDVTGLNTTGENPELIYPTWGLLILTAIIALVALCTVFLFRKRILQIRFCIFNALLMIGFYGLVCFVLWHLKSQYPDFHISIKFALSFPLVSLILDYLAIRNIGADEALIRSLERLR